MYITICPRIMATRIKSPSCRGWQVAMATVDGIPSRSSRVIFKPAPWRVFLCPWMGGTSAGAMESPLLLLRGWRPVNGGSGCGRDQISPARDWSQDSFAAVATPAAVAIVALTSASV